MARKYKKVPLRTSIYIRVLNETGFKAKDIQRKIPSVSLRQIYRHLKKPVEEDVSDKRKKNTGRPRLMTVRDERKMLRNLVNLRNDRACFSVRRLQEESDLGHVSTRTVCRHLHSNGYGYYQSRKKGLVTAKDRTIRLAFAKRHLKTPLDFWTNGIAFYFDGVSFAFKTNPSGEARALNTMEWRKRNEGLSRTTKGKKEGTGGKTVSMFVGISHGRGVILNEQVQGVTTGESFGNFVRNYFHSSFIRSMKESRVFLQDGDPKQNSAAARIVLTRRGYEIFSIPARSPDLNPIENMFNLVRKQLHEDAITRNITKEKYEEFAKRVKDTLNDFPVDILDRTIESLPRRMELIINGKGCRTKY